MEPLLLFSLFVTHLAVGGELPQYSTGVVYVSDDGIDDSSCLNGGSLQWEWFTTDNTTSVSHLMVVTATLMETF